MKVRIDIKEIRKLYRKKGIYTDKDFCIKTGVSIPTFKRISSSQRGMSLKIALIIADYLECDIRDFAEVTKV